MRLTIRISDSKDSAETDPKPEDYVQLSEDMGFAKKGFRLDFRRTGELYDLKDDDLFTRLNEGRYLYEY